MKKIKARFLLIYYKGWCLRLSPLLVSWINFKLNFFFPLKFKPFIFLSAGFEKINLKTNVSIYEKKLG